MAPRYRTIEREQLMLLPHDLREWIPAGDIVHFIIEAASLVRLDKFKVNDRGTGEAQYHPQMMLALLLYCYSHGTFGSRRIERATWKDVAVRYICGNLHPDHDTICDFRIRNEKAITEAFLQVLNLAKEMGVLKVGTVSVDGTKIKANASIHKSLRYDRAGQIEAQLELEISELMSKARTADNSDVEGKTELAQELQRLETLREKMRQAQETLEKRAKDRAAKPKKNKTADKDDSEDPPPPPRPEAHEQVNLTDHESRIMRKNDRSSYEQAYNAQAVVDADGTMLVLGVRVSDQGPDAGQLVLDVEAVPQELGPVVTVLADTGYANGTTVQKLQGQGIEVLVALGRQTENGHKHHDFRPVPTEARTKTPAQKWNKPWAVAMKQALESDRGRNLYRLRKQTVEPVFGIVKQALGFRQFLLRGLDKVNLEWKLITCAYNLKRLAVLR
jgi:transposase